MGCINATYEANPSNNRRAMERTPSKIRTKHRSLMGCISAIYEVYSRRATERTRHAGRMDGRAEWHTYTPPLATSLCGGGGVWLNSTITYPYINYSLLTSRKESPTFTSDLSTCIFIVAFLKTSKQNLIRPTKWTLNHFLLITSGDA